MDAGVIGKLEKEVDHGRDAFPAIPVSYHRIRRRCPDRES